MFHVGDVIRHRKSGIYYIVIRQNIYNKSYTELITYEAVRIDDDHETVIMHHPIMTSYFDVVKSFVDSEK